MRWVTVDMPLSDKLYLIEKVVLYYVDFYPIAYLRPSTVSERKPCSANKGAWLRVRFLQHQANLGAHLVLALKSLIIMRNAAPAVARHLKNRVLPGVFRYHDPKGPKSKGALRISYAVVKLLSDS